MKRVKFYWRPICAGLAQLPDTEVLLYDTRASYPTTSCAIAKFGLHEARAAGSLIMIGSRVPFSTRCHPQTSDQTSHLVLNHICTCRNIVCTPLDKAQLVGDKDARLLQIIVYYIKKILKWIEIFILVFKYDKSIIKPFHRYK